MNLDQESKMDYRSKNVMLLREGKGMKALGWEWKTEGPWVLQYNPFKESLWSKKKAVKLTDKIYALFLQWLLHLKNINLLPVNPEEAPVAAYSVVDIKGLALLLDHLDLGEFYIKGAEVFSSLDCNTKNSDFEKLKSRTLGHGSFTAHRTLILLSL